MSEALAEPVKAAQTQIQPQAVVNMDETSWREGQKRVWVWEVVAPQVTVFEIHDHRSGETAQKILGATFGGIVGSDRYRTGMN